MKPLLIPVDDIVAAAQPWEAELSRAEIDEMLSSDRPSEYKAAGKTTVKAKLTKMGKKVLVQSSFEVPLEGACKRCLKEVPLTETVDVTLTFVPAPEPKPVLHDRRKGASAAVAVDDAPKRHGKKPVLDEEGPGGSFTAETADEEPYHGKSLDLWPLIREQVLLFTPPSPLCSESCQGLCATCGQDLNVGDCGHREEKSVHPRWAALQGLQVKSTKS